MMSRVDGIGGGKGDAYQNEGEIWGGGVVVVQPAALIMYSPVIVCYNAGGGFGRGSCSSLGSRS